MMHIRFYDDEKVQYSSQQANVYVAFYNRLF